MAAWCEQEDWTPAHRGEFRMFLPDGAGDTDVGGHQPAVDPAGHAYVDLAPRGGRLIAFWSDTMVHSVCVVGGESYRWALTVWLHTTDVQRIQFDSAAEERHFTGMGAAAGGLEG